MKGDTLDHKTTVIEDSSEKVIKMGDVYVPIKTNELTKMFLDLEQKKDLLKSISMEQTQR